MNTTNKHQYQHGFASIITTIATGILVLTTMAASAPTLAEAPEANTAYIELAHRYDVSVPKQGLSDDQKILLVKAAKVEQYYRNQKTDMPMADYAYEFVLAADRYDIDYALMPAIARFETSGGRNLCKSDEFDNSYNPFGFGSCRMGFDSFEHAFDHVAYSLSGQNPNTKIYGGKTNQEKLYIYNPPSVKGILPGYHRHILKAIDEIKSQTVEIDGYVIK